MDKIADKDRRTDKEADVTTLFIEKLCFLKAPLIFVRLIKVDLVYLKFSSQNFVLSVL